MTTKRTFQPKQREETFNQWGPVTLPTNSMVAIYARQSTKKQAENNRESAEMQTTDLVALAHRLGWDDEHIILYVENRREDGTIKNASGRLRIDERENLQALVSRIEHDEVKAVIVFLEDRLFRDETMIQPYTFIDICRRHNCLVITPHMTYNFRRDYDIEMFADRCKSAARYITDYVRVRLHGGRARVAARGEYIGMSIPMGYTIDTDKDSPFYRKYTPYEAHATVIRSLFQRYKELDGKFNLLVREVEAMPYLFPDFTPDVDVKYRKKNTMLKVAGGYKPTRDALKSILTNIAYIGYWIYDGTIIQDNHAPIVESELFFYAFNRLSTYDLTEGKQELPKYRVRYTQQGSAPREALLEDVITAGKDKTVLVQADRHNPASYKVYKRQSRRYSNPIIPLSIHVATVDAVIVERIKHLARTTNMRYDLLNALQEVQQTHEQAIVSVDSQLKTIEKQIAGKLATLDLPPDDLDPVTRAECAKSLKKLRETKAELEEKKRKADTATSEQEIVELADAVENINARWGKLPYERKKRLINLLVGDVCIAGVSPHFIAINVTWGPPFFYRDTALLWRAKGARTHWSDEELELLSTHYASTDRQALVEMLPTHSWAGVRLEAHKLGLRRKVSTNNSSIPDEVTLQDWNILQRVGLPKQPEQDVAALWLLDLSITAPELVLEDSVPDTAGETIFTATPNGVWVNPERADEVLCLDNGGYMFVPKEQQIEALPVPIALDNSNDNHKALSEPAPIHGKRRRRQPSSRRHEQYETSASRASLSKTSTSSPANSLLTA